MVGTKITRPRDEWHKNNSPRDGRMERYMTVTKITCPRDGQHKSNSPKDGDSNDSHGSNSPKGWTAQK